MPRFYARKRRRRVTSEPVCPCETAMGVAHFQCEHDELQRTTSVIPRFVPARQVVPSEACYAFGSPRRAATRSATRSTTTGAL